MAEEKTTLVKSNVNGRLIIKDLDISFNHKGQQIVIKEEAFNLSKDVKRAISQGFVSVVSRPATSRKYKYDYLENLIKEDFLKNLLEDIKVVLDELKQSAVQQTQVKERVIYKDSADNSLSDTFEVDPALTMEISNKLKEDSVSNLNPEVSKGDKLDKSEIENVKSLMH